MEVVKKHAGHGFTQFELTKDLLNNLQQFNITPVAKLVLLYLSSCYNPKKADIFPKQKTIADKIGVSEVSVTRAISELHKEGLIVSERKYSNRYKFTARISFESPQKEQNNLIDEKLQIDRKETIKLIGHEHEQIKRTNKTTNVVSFNSIEFEDFKILKDYALKHGAKNVNAYIKVLRENGADKRIIADYKAKKGAEEYAKNQIAQTAELVKTYNTMVSEPPTQGWKDLKMILVQA